MFFGYSKMLTYTTISVREVMKMKTKHNKMGRKVLDEKQKVDRELLKQKFLENSLEALETIINIMRFSMDSTARLKASTFILNKVVPEGFVFDNETNRNITLNIVTRSSADETIPFEEQERIIREAENEVYEDDEEWGTDLYIPK